VFTVNGAGTPTSWFFNLLAGDRVVGRQPNVGTRRYYHADLLGSTRSVVEGATVVESYDFEPWGLLLPGRTLGGGTKEGFTGKEQDAETGLDYFGARYYMPALGRWTGVDPLAEKHPEWSAYNYVLNNPLVLIDPDGRQVSANRMLMSARDVEYLHTNAAALASGRMQPTATADLEFSRLMDQAASAGARAYVDLFVAGASITPFDGPVSTGADILYGRFTLPNTLLNFAPGPGGSKISDVAEGLGDAGRTSRRLGGDAAQEGPTEAYNRRRHYGATPTKGDRKALGAGEGEVVDHDPPLVQRYYDGDPRAGERPGYQMTSQERRASANDRRRQRVHSQRDSNKQGAEMSQYSKEQRKRHGLQ